jgi:hypothetical protein
MYFDYVDIPAVYYQKNTGIVPVGGLVYLVR